MTPGARSSLARATATATLASIAAYAVTLLQQVLYGRTLGVGPDTDALAAAIAWAVATSGLVGTTLLSVFLPRYTRLLADEPALAGILLRTGSTLGLAFGAMAGLATILGADVIAQVLLPGSDEATVVTLAGLLMPTALLHLTWIGVWLWTTLANARERYVLAALAPIAAAIPVIGVLALVADPPVSLVAIAYVAGTLAQIVVVVLAIGRGGVDLLPVLHRAAMRGLGRPLVGIGAAFVSFSAAGLALRALASTHASGDVAVVDYASRLAIVAEQIVLTGLLAVLLTRLSQSAMREVTGRSLSRVLPTVVDLAVLTAALLMLFGTDVVRILLASVRFDPAAVQSVGLFLTWMGPGIAAHMIFLVLLRAMVASAATGGVLTLGLTVATVTAAVGVLLQSLGLVSVALAFDASWIAGLTIAAVLVLDRTGAIGAIREGLRAVTIAVVAGIPALLVLANCPGGPLLRLVAGGGVFVVISTVTAVLLRAAAVESIREVVWRYRSAATSGRKP